MWTGRIGAGPSAIEFSFPGFVRDGLPVGLQVLGRAWSEPTLIRIVYGYEQATRHRRPPASTPPLPARP